LVFVIYSIFIGLQICTMCLFFPDYAQCSRSGVRRDGDAISLSRVRQYQAPLVGGMAVTISGKLAFFREKCLLPSYPYPRFFVNFNTHYHLSWFQSFISSFCADFVVSYYVSVNSWHVFTLCYLLTSHHTTSTACFLIILFRIRQLHIICNRL